MSDGGPFARLIKYNTPEIIEFENSPSKKIYDEFSSFWTKKEDYLSRGEQHKRGYLLWGPPGGGKTSLVLKIVNDFIKNYKGIVFVFTPDILSFLPTFRDIEPDRKIIIVIEDIDAWFMEQRSNALLSLLDGESPLVNTVVLATTNYPERLPDRVRNRPSRFDQVVFIDNPTKTQRREYLLKKSNILGTEQAKKWADDTDGFSFAHLKELLLGVEVFGSEYSEVLNRLNEMRKAKDSSDQYEERMRGGLRTPVGFGGHMSDKVREYNFE
jgi:SpoVK/Ycf46/Vps4 family AAA+-type ATPase